MNGAHLHMYPNIDHLSSCGVFLPCMLYLFDRVLRGLNNLFQQAAEANTAWVDKALSQEHPYIVCSYDKSPLQRPKDCVRACGLKSCSGACMYIAYVISIACLLAIGATLRSWSTMYKWVKEITSRAKLKSRGSFWNKFVFIWYAMHILNDIVVFIVMKVIPFAKCFITICFCGKDKTLFNQIWYDFLWLRCSFNYCWNWPGFPPKNGF